MAELIKGRQAEARKGDKSSKGGGVDGNANEERDDHDAPFSSERLKPEGGILANIVQLLPLFVVFPIWQIARYLMVSGCYRCQRLLPYHSILTLAFLHRTICQLSSLV
jgi:hypothetical protein